MMRARISTDKLSVMIFGYLMFVVLVAVALPLLALLVHRGYASVTWIHPESYKHHLVAGVVLLIVFAATSRYISRACHHVAEWLLQSPIDRNRWVSVGVILLIMTSHAWQTHIIISHRGVPGWVYRAIDPVIQEAPNGVVNLPVDVDLVPFQAALQSEPLPYLQHDGYATGELMFLHFRDGSMRPANLALSIVSWPRSTFGLDAGEVKNGDDFLELIRHSFAKRRAGRKFILPISISYPGHLNYQEIDYTDYPPAEELVGVSFWEATIRVTVATKSLEISGLKVLAKVGRP